MVNLPISISKFAADPNLLNLQLWPKQIEILEQFWTGDFSLAVWALGRRSGKTLMAAVTAIYAATMLADEYRIFLRVHEKFYIISIANTQDQSRIAIQNVKDLVKNSPILKHMIVRETADSLELNNGAVFKAMPASSRGGRGMAVPLLIFDEIAHAIETEAGNASGNALYQALSPSVAQFGKLGKILLLSSPWVQSGIFWDLFKQASSGQFDHMQVRQEPSWVMNPTLSEQFLEQEKARDPELFRIEYGAEFSQSLASFIASDLIDAAVVERTILLPNPKFKGKYFCSLDPAKGGRDKYTACIAHWEKERLVIDKFHEFKPSYIEGKKIQVSIQEVETWILEHHHLYKFSQVTLDQYNSQATIQRLQKEVPIQEIVWTVNSKTQAFSQLRELFNGGNIELYPHDQALSQLKNLIVVYRPGGSWSVSGGNGAAVDDYCSALAGILLCARPAKKLAFTTLPMPYCY